jgi:hypothetical protein
VLVNYPELLESVQNWTGLDREGVEAATIATVGADRLGHDVHLDAISESRRAPPVRCSYGGVATDQTDDQSDVREWIMEATDAESGARRAEIHEH